MVSIDSLILFHKSMYVVTKKFLADISAALDIFDDEISSLGDCRATAYETFILTYRSAFSPRYGQR